MKNLFTVSRKAGSPVVMGLLFLFMIVLFSELVYGSSSLRLTALFEQLDGPNGYQPATLEDVLQRTLPLAENDDATPNIIRLRSEALQLQSVVFQRQGRWLAAWQAIEQSMKQLDRLYPNGAYDLNCLPQLDQFAFLTTVYRERYALPLQLRQLIRKLLATLPLEERLRKFEEITVNNLIRLADLYDRTGKPQFTDRLLEELDELVNVQMVSTDAQFPIRLFKVHRQYHRNAFPEAERQARALLTWLQEHGGDARELAAVQALYGRTLLGLGQPNQALHYLRAAQQNYGYRAASVAPEQLELLADLVRCHRARGEFATERILIQRQIDGVEAASMPDALRQADLAADLADSYYAEYRLEPGGNLEMLLRSVRHDRTSRSHYYRHRAALRDDFDAQWTIGTEQTRRDRTVAILHAAFQQTKSEAYFYEAWYVLERDRSLPSSLSTNPMNSESTDWRAGRDRLETYFDRANQRDQTLLRYVCTDEQLYLLGRSKKGLVFRALPIGRQAITTQVKSLRKSLLRAPGQPRLVDLDNLARQSHDLYELLLASVTAIATDRLLILADKTLTGLPFSLLLSAPVTASTPCSEWPFAVRKYAFNYAHTLSTSSEGDRRSDFAAKREVLAFAPKFEPGHLRGEASRSGKGELYRNTTEVEGLTGNFPCRVFIGEEARLETFLRMAPHYAVLHLATHAVADADYGDESYLTFSKQESSDHLLSVKSLGSLQLAAELVVLSACETGLGEWQPGLGTISLEWAFRQAGARSLVSTYWKVSDGASARLMQLFYDHLEGGQQKDVALQRAQLDFLHQANTWSAHPFFWAGFVQQGATEPLDLTKPSTRWRLVPLLLCLLGVMYLYRRRSSVSV